MLPTTTIPKICIASSMRRYLSHTARYLYAEEYKTTSMSSNAPSLTKDQAKKRELKRLAQRRAEAKRPATTSPLYMPVAMALRYLRAAEVGRPQSQQTINLTTLVVGERGTAPISGNVTFPKPLRYVKVAVFTNDEIKLKELREKYPNHLIGGADLVAKIKNNEIPVDFDKAFATPDIVPTLQSQVARILGPRGVLPSVKKGTVNDDITSLLQESLGSMPFRQRGNAISVGIGKCYFTDRELLQNIISTRAAFKAAVENQKAKKPSILSKTTLSSTHGPGIVIDFA
ncbi:mitochondrial 54S ribosomal protein uL1m [Saccharomyces eubayanus]|uniref:mitochondrial 54S ribosomal protein uL1m n=1 Tax=Saccharomyces eubayanus TaxID=1080349 RepID=UPI0006C5001D|nr:MRPL1-like protein [Saccharomyces eubayanus]KOH00963.1 MRPL1-like protein [Saccharomyces eubayanus]